MAAGLGLGSARRSAVLVGLGVGFGAGVGTDAGVVVERDVNGEDGSSAEGAGLDSGVRLKEVRI
jgi:hypothetical protein